jgi:23S rRNA (guanosine2251-2'-O)-methyltransferase
MSDASRFIFGIHPVLEALVSRKREVVAVYTSEDPVERQAKNVGAPCERKTRAELDEIAGRGARHQGAIAIVGEYPYVEAESLLEPAPALVLVLDGVTDPQNLGALVRSAHVLGATGIVVPKDRAAQVTPAVVRVSAGATEHARIASVTNLVRTIEDMKERGVWVVGAALEADAELPWAVDFREPTAIVIGAEGTGLRRLTRKVCDRAVRIPMGAGGATVGSLNASAAGAVLLYEAARQRALPAQPRV